MDFTQYEGISDEIKTQLAADYQTDVEGLKAKNSDLINRANTLKEANEAERLTNTQAAEDAKLALIEKDGSIADYKAALLERDEKIEIVKREFKETENKRLTESAVNEFSGALVDDPAGRMYMQSKFLESVDVVDGQVIPKDTTKTLAELREGLVTDQAHLKYVKASTGSGSGSAGNTGSGSAGSSGKKYSDMNPEQKRDFLSKQNFKRN
jgi:ABC-type phosphate/phosphonate transport system substrate-binding protein